MPRDLENTLSKEPFMQFIKQDIPCYKKSHRIRNPTFSSDPSFRRYIYTLFKPCKHSETEGPKDRSAVTCSHPNYPTLTKPQAKTNQEVRKARHDPVNPESPAELNPLITSTSHKRLCAAWYIVVVLPLICKLSYFALFRDIYML